MLCLKLPWISLDDVAAPTAYIHSWRLSLLLVSRKGDVCASWSFPPPTSYLGLIIMYIGFEGGPALYVEYEVHLRDGWIWKKR